MSDTITFQCLHCSAKLRVKADKAGLTANCPKCGQRTPIPEPNIPEAKEEPATYGLAEAPEPGAGGAGAFEQVKAWSNEPGRPTDDDWCTPRHDALPMGTRMTLGKARTFARRRDWKQALGTLNPVFRSVGAGEITHRNHFVRKPLAFCLLGWAVDDLDALDRESPGLSKVMQKLLANTEKRVRWGGTFDPNRCALCDYLLPEEGHAVRVQTAAGSAYLCCGAPTREDRALVEAVGGVRRRLTFAQALDDQNAMIPQALAALPWWQWLVVTEGVQGEVKWWKKVKPAAAAAAGAGVAEAAEESGLADVVGSILGGLLG